MWGFLPAVVLVFDVVFSTETDLVRVFLVGSGSRAWIRVRFGNGDCGRSGEAARFTG
jgi:hypothetical protein